MREMMTRLLLSMNKQRRAFRKRPMAARAGFTLIEVMVAMAILAIGVLGVTAMQVGSIGGQVSTAKTDACANLVADVISRIRANADNVGDYEPFEVTAGGSGGGGGIAQQDYAELAADMLLMNVPSSASLSAVIQANTPVAGVSTVTASLTWDSNATGPLCNAMDIIRRDK